MIKYVAGFLFSVDGSLVALISKSKGPPAVVGRMNGIGGKIEPGEEPTQAMRREFLEETGVDVDDWHAFATLAHPDWSVEFFVAYSDSVLQVRTMETEPVSIVQTRYMTQLPVVPNVMWLIPMALSLKRGESADHFVITESSVHLG